MGDPDSKETSKRLVPKSLFHLKLASDGSDLTNEEAEQFKVLSAVKNAPYNPWYFLPQTLGSTRNGRSRESRRKDRAMTRIVAGEDNKSSTLKKVRRNISQNCVGLPRQHSHKTN